MPQLDFTTYSSQIFWLCLCFATLYFFVSKIIIPRISSILTERKNVIDSNNSLAAELNKKIQEFSLKTEKLRKEAANSYQIKLEEVTKNSLRQREKAMEELKAKIDENVKKSRQELKNFMEESYVRSKSAAKDLEQRIKEKLFSN